MRKLSAVVMLLLLILSLTSCSSQPIESIESSQLSGPSDSSESSATAGSTKSSTSTIQPTDPSETSMEETESTTSHESTSSQQETSASLPEGMLGAPLELFDSAFNPFGMMDLPDSSTVFAASYSKGSEKMAGKCLYVLSMTAGGDMSAAIGFHADAAGLSEDEKKARIKEYLDGGFCEFHGEDDRVVTIRKTNPDDDRYEYVDGGCLIDLTFLIDVEDSEKYANLMRANYNLNALALISKYLDKEPDWSSFDISVNLHKQEACCSVAYPVVDAEVIQQNLAAEIDSNWWEWNGLMQMTFAYGMIECKLTFDNEGDLILVEQRSSEFATALGDYAEPAVSLNKLGFGFDQEGVCGVYEQHEPYYLSVAIHKPEWGDFPDDWNIEYMDVVNGYGLRITYHASEDKFRITVNHDGKAEGKFDFNRTTGVYDGQYPDVDTVAQMFNDAFGTQGEDFYDEPLAFFEQLVKDRFGLSIDEIYALPKK